MRPFLKHFRLYPFSPILNLGTLLSKPQYPLPFPFDRPNTLSIGYGRLAIYYGINALGVKAGDNIVIPSFICGAAVAAFIKANVNVRYYDSDDKLNPDTKSIEKLIDESTRAVMSVNYFGFPQEISGLRAICKKYGIYHIEDNAHGFLSSDNNNPLGSFGDISIFSFRKTLPLPNGAALLVNNPEIPIGLPTLPDAPSKIKSGKFLIRSMLRRTETISGIHLVTRFPDFETRHPTQDHSQTKTDHNDDETNFEKYCYGINSLSERIIKRCNYAKIRRTRINAYNFWLDYLKRATTNTARPLFPELPSGVIPHSCPVVGDFAGLAAKLQGQKIECAVWPTLPQASKGWRFGKVLLLPVHELPAKL